MNAKGKKEVFGYNGKILKVDLSRQKIEVEEPDQGFYRTYLGGGLLGTYYVYKETEPGVDPLSAGNVLVFAPSVTTGAPVAGASRFNISAKSPLTGAIGDTQCGGGWGPKLKHAGFDAVVIKGRADGPVYLWLDQGQAEIRDAGHIWGKVTGEAQRTIQAELGDNHIEVAQIGPGGERMVRFACVTGGLSHFAGRTGMGAVMGSKNLKAIAVRGKRNFAFADEAAVKQKAQKCVHILKNAEGLQIFHKQGTALGVMINKALGNIVTRNFQAGAFEKTEELSAEKMIATNLKGTDTCWACPIRCKRVVAQGAPYPVDPQYGGPEFETLMMLGSNLGIGDMAVVAKASEVCNKNTLDTISAGGMIALTMECFEKGIISSKDAEGLVLKFGHADDALRLLEMIVQRQGIGDVLADGPERVIAEWGSQISEFAVHVKNQSCPAHDPRVKQSQALMYAVNPFGADHMSSEHDWIAAGDGDVPRSLGITEFTTYDRLDRTKVRGTMLSQYYYSLLDTLTLCAFPWGPNSIYSPRDLEEFIQAVTGWQTSFWELMKAGERRINLMRAFNAREKLDRSNDRLPPRLFDPLSAEGVFEGKAINRAEFNDRLAEYYEMMSWDPRTGNPTRGKLMELGLGWVLDN
jgi:aldehyde:ferredoxin oxidoreductase